MIELTNVTRSYGANSAVRALKDINLHVGRAERVAVMGPSGSGKSTLLNLICGLDEPTTGSVKVDGVELSGLSDDARTRLRREKIGMIFQTFNLLPTLSALENVALPLRLQGLSKKDAEGTATSMLGHVGLTGRITHRPDELSGGERQRVAIARALIFVPRCCSAMSQLAILTRPPAMRSSPCLTNCSRNTRARCSWSPITPKRPTIAIGSLPFMMVRSCTMCSQAAQPPE